MKRLADIPIKVESPRAAPVGALDIEPLAEGLGQGGSAILVELVELLDRLATTQISGAIDLHGLPMTDLDRSQLQARLGRGEVRAFLDAEGVSEIQETAIPGVWWIQHRDKDRELIAELLEVSASPSILARAKDEIASGVDMLRERIAQPSRPLGATPADGQ